MMKKIFSFVIVAIVAAIACCFTSCEKKEVYSVVTFYGTVVDAITGEPVWNASVTGGDGWSSTHQTVTGNDGTYEFDLFFETPDDYQTFSRLVVIEVSKTGYEQPIVGNSTHIYHECTKAELGKRVKVDFSIKPVK